MLTRISVLATAIAFWMAPMATAQYAGTPDEVHATGTSYHIFAQPGEPTITVQLLGDVGGSGVYVVGEDTSLSRLVALAGGAPVADLRGDVRGTYTVRVYRDGSGMRTPVYEADWQQFVRAPSNHPRLLDGDTVTLDLAVQQRFDLLRTVSVVSGLSALALLVIRIVEVF